MTGDGWAKGADGIWAKGGVRATIEFKTTAGNKRRELTQQIVQEQAKNAGFEITINNAKAGDLFGQILPKGDYQLALYAQVLTNLEPGNCSLFCSKNIPTEANGNVGQNWQRVNIPELDTLSDPGRLRGRRRQAGRRQQEGRQDPGREHDLSPPRPAAQHRAGVDEGQGRHHGEPDHLHLRRRQPVEYELTGRPSG